MSLSRRIALIVWGVLAIGFTSSPTASAQGTPPPKLPRTDGSAEPAPPPSSSDEIDFTDPERRDAYLRLGSLAVESIPAALDEKEWSYEQFEAAVSILRELLWRSHGDERTERQYMSTLARVAQQAKRPSVSELGVRLLGELTSPKTLQYLRFKLEEPRFISAAIEALTIHPSTGAGDILSTALRDGKLKDHVAEAVRGLGRRREIEAIPDIAKSLQSEDPALVRTAVTALARMPSFAAARALEPLANGESDHRVPALMAIRSIGHYLERNGAPGEARRLYRWALDTIPSREGQGLGWIGLRTTATREDIGFIHDQMKRGLDGPARDGAMMVALELPTRVPLTEDPEGYRALYRSFLEQMQRDSFHAQILESRIRRIVPHPELVDCEDGVFRNFWVLGPFLSELVSSGVMPRTDADLAQVEAHWEQPNGPEEVIDLQETRIVGRRILEWLWISMPEGEDTFLLERAISPPNHAVAYLYAQIEVEKAGPALLLTGSEDSIQAWVNDEKVLSVLEARDYTADADTTPIALREGRNRFLLKVGKLGDSWRVSARIVDAKGNPIPFTVH